MASDTTKALGSEIAAALLVKAKEYRLANIDERMASSKTTGVVDYRLQGKRDKIVADDESVTWKFDVVESGDSVEIVATAPRDRGGLVSTWGVITAQGRIGKDALSAGEGIDLTDDAAKESLLASMSHLGTHW